MSSKFLDKTGMNTLWAKIKSTFQTIGNLVTSWSSTPSDTKYPSEKLVKAALDGKAASSHAHTLLSAEQWTNAQLPNNSERDYFKRFYTYVDSYLAAVKLYDVTEFYDGTIVNDSNEQSTFVGDVSFIRSDGFPLVSKSKVCMTQCYNSSGVILYGDTTKCHPIVLKDSRNVLSSWISGSYIPTGNIGSTVNMTPTVNINMAHCVIDCASYSTLYVNLSTVTGAPAWTFVDSANKVIAKTSSINVNATVDVPQGAAKIICAIKNTAGIKQYSYVAAESATPRYYLALQTNIIMGSYMVCEGRFLTRTTATSTISARPLITEDFAISNTGAQSTVLPAGYSVHKDTSYVDVAGTLGTARKLAVSLSNTSTDTLFDGSANVTNIKVTGTLPVSKGGTGKTSAPAAEYNLLSNARTEITTYDDDSRFLCESKAPSEQIGIISGFRKASTIWNYIMGKISSVLGLTATNYGGTADTATKVSGTQIGQDSNARHLWFSTTVETQRGYIDALTYRTDTNTISANISGNAATATTATNYNTSSGNIKTALDGKSSTSHTHSVSINGSTKTIAASGGTAVDLGTYKVFNYARVYAAQTYNADTRRYILLAFRSTTYTHNWEESSMFKLVVNDGQLPKELVFRLWLTGTISDNVVPSDPSNPKLYRVYSENFSTSALNILDVRLFVVEKSTASIKFIIGIFIDRNYLQAQYVSYQLYPLSYSTYDRGNYIDNGLSSWTYTVENNSYYENIMHDNVFTTVFKVSDLPISMNIVDAYELQYLTGPITSLNPLKLPNNIICPYGYTPQPGGSYIALSQFVKNKTHRFELWEPTGGSVLIYNNLGVTIVYRAVTASGYAEYNVLERDVIILNGSGSRVKPTSAWATLIGTNLYVTYGY